MNLVEDYFLSRNKILEEKIDLCLHNIESRLDKLFERAIDLGNDGFTETAQAASLTRATQQTNPIPSKPSNLFSNFTFMQFKTPYIRDFRNFSGPTNDDVRQIQGLTGTENIDSLIRSKSWSKESRQQLKDAVLDHYAQIHLIQLLKQKNHLLNQIRECSSRNEIESKAGLEQKVSLIDEQAEQVRARKEQRIFVPHERMDLSVDWCAISAKLTNTQHDAQDCRLMWSNQLHWAISDEAWTHEEDICLQNAVEKYGKNDWDAVANELNCNRLPWQCCSRYQEAFANPSGASNHINEDDSEKIIEVVNLCRLGNFVPWNQVMYFIQYHSLLQVKYQWHKFLAERKSGLPWSHTEDVLLLNTIQRFGDKDWSRVASYIPDRSNKSCRERYMMRLKYERRTLGNWTRKEDQSLIDYVGRFGTNWALISSHFPERNDHQLRNRYELLSKDAGRVVALKRRKIQRNADGLMVSVHGRQKKAPSDLEVDEKLHEIFNSYQHVKSSTKSLVCRSSQDELIYQTLIQVIRKYIGTGEPKESLLSITLEKALEERTGARYGLMAPCASTMRGFKAWKVQQDYLAQFLDEPVDLESMKMTDEYQHLLKVTVSLFLWPAILSRLKTPEVDFSKCPANSIIERDSKNLYIIRNIQQRFISEGL